MNNLLKIIEENKKELEKLIISPRGFISENEVLSLQKSQTIKLLEALQEEVENPSYVGVLDSNERRRGHDIAIINISSLLSDIINQIKK